MNHRPRKRFGQNFLHDQNVVERIVLAISPRRDQHLVEIGPGKGALTRPLLDRVDKLDVIEIDRDLAPHLEHELGQFGRLRVHQADALTFDFRHLARDGRKLRVVGNLPYNVSTPLLFHLLDQVDVVEDMHFMLQKEVVDRMAAAPNSDDYGRLSVMIQFFCKVEKMFNVKPGSFFPAPKVDSAVVRLIPHTQPIVAVDDVAMFSRVVTAAFAQRRKTLRNALKGLLDQDGIIAAGVLPDARAETLGLAQFASLSNVTHKSLLTKT
ncbi:MAG: 16S rRNA (adenine(1518)-N(6)/adenine(1519)-N(6))-dimethyltransferase RsmA [Gammaproteobacteria bacterium]|nr:16S rRNA (adenine(1518)-N(6)/adenine(1519)-N(6))-dimethyltransferase RsmA [Gammaproteobacteria bacterium]